MKREVFDVRGAVKYCGNLVSEWLFRREISAGHIPHFRIGARILLDRQELDKWIESQVQQSIAPKAQPERLRRAK